MSKVKEEKKGPAGYSIEVYQREDGWWSFRVNGQESRYRSSNEHGLQRTINSLLRGPAQGGSVRVKAVKGDAKALPALTDDRRKALEAKGFTAEQIETAASVMLVDDPLPDNHWSLKPTTAERVAAFLNR